MENLKKTSLSKFLKLCALLLSFTLLPGCEEDAILLAGLKNILIGTWQAIPTEQYKPSGELLIEFKADNTIGLHPTMTGDTYSLISTSAIDIRWEHDYGQGGYTYEITFNEDLTITIYNFHDGTTTLNEKNITFKKIK